MGITRTQVQIIEAIAPRGARIITAGRQRLFTEFLPIGRTRETIEYFGTDDLTREKHWHVSHMDISDFEGAEVIQDLNAPFDRDTNSAHLRGHDVVIDSGTLEHVFNIPEALRTYDSLVKLGGIVYITTNANNHFGHGFYQFSSDLFFRWFSETNGYEMIYCFLESHPTISAEISRSRRYYDVSDPAALRQRTLLLSRDPTLIHVIARKLADTPLSTSLIQSGYADRWVSATPATKAGRGRSLARRLRAALPALWRPLAIYRMRWRHRLGMNRNFPRRRDPSLVVRAALSANPGGVLRS